MILRKTTHYMLALTLCAVLLLTGCGRAANQPEPTPVPTPRPVLEEVNFATYNKFAIELLKKSRTEGENIIISPMTIGVALTMLGMGARGDTADGIQDALDMDFGDFYRLTENCGLIMNELEGLSGLSYDVGFGLYVGEGPTIREDYAVTMEDFFKLDLNFTEFDDDKLETQINEWAHTTTMSTSSQITSLFPENTIDHDMTAMLISVSAADCVWDVGFNPNNTRTWPFLLDSGRSIAVPTMQGQMAINIYEDEQVKAGFFPLAGGHTTLAIMIPPEGDTLDDFLYLLNGDQLALWKALSYETTQWVFMPKVNLRRLEPHKFSHSLSDMGANEMFDPALADFTGIGSGIHLNEIYQSAQIRIEESGTETSTVTNVDIKRARNNGEEFFEVNRTFVFAVIDEASSGILILGTLSNPIDQ